MRSPCSGNALVPQKSATSAMRRSFAATCDGYFSPQAPTQVAAYTSPDVYSGDATVPQSSEALGDTDEIRERGRTGADVARRKQKSPTFDDTDDIMERARTASGVAHNQQKAKSVMLDDRDAGEVPKLRERARTVDIVPHMVPRKVHLLERLSSEDSSSSSPFDQVKSDKSSSEALTYARQKSLTGDAILRTSSERDLVGRERTETRFSLKCQSLGAADLEFIPWDPSEPEELGRTIHFKGFAARVNFEEEDTLTETKNTIDFFKNATPDTVVWDGDNLEPDSFTALIPEIYHSARPRLVMFLRDTPEERQRVKSSWKETLLPITCFLLSADLTFEQLGAEALKATQSKIVFCFGGGLVLQKEWQAASKDIRFVLARTCRGGLNPEDRLQMCSLASMLVQQEKPENLDSVSHSRNPSRYPDAMCSAATIHVSRVTSSPHP